MPRSIQIPLFDFISSLSRVVDMMNKEVVDHHMRVAYIALRLAEEAGKPYDFRRDAALAAALHDIGAFSSRERLHLLQFEIDSPHSHAEAGYLLLRGFEPFHQMARIVRFHHVPWQNGEGARFRGKDVPDEAQCVHLADRVAVLLEANRPPLQQAGEILKKVRELSGVVFAPEYVEALVHLAPREFFWLEACSESLEHIIRRLLRWEVLDLDTSQLVAFSKLMCRIIDFKSSFTATHSSGVAAVAVALAAKVGFSERERQVMEVAAYLHDLGKMAIPSEILEKPGRLTAEERQVMQSHVYYTYEVLAGIQGFDLINEWSALHQERVDGKGYPFHYDARELSLGARTMAVADVFTALTEDRPYRKGVSREAAFEMLRGMGENGHLDRQIVGLVLAHFDEVNAARALAQQEAAAEYRQFVAALD